MANGWQMILGVAYVLTFVTITLMCIAMGTEHWVRYEVDRTTLKKELITLDLYNLLFTHQIYWTRYRGLYRFCFPDEQYLQYFPSPGKTNGDIICYTEDAYDFNSADNITTENDAKSDYEKRNHLLRAVSAMFALSLLANLIGFCVAIVGSCRRLISSSKYAAAWAALGSILAVAGMGMFHAVHVMETDTIKLEQFKAGWSTMNDHRFLEDSTTIDFSYSYMIGWIAAGINLFSIMFYLFAAFSLAEYTRRIQEMTSLVGPSSKQQLTKAYTAYNSRVPPMGALYGHNTNSIYQTGKGNDAADEFFRAEAGRNQAYDLAADYNKIVNEDRPGESSEINKQIRPVREKPESWYDEYKKQEQERKNARKYDDRRPLPRYADRRGGGYTDKYSDRNYREERISHPYGYGHHQRGRYRDFY